MIKENKLEQPSLRPKSFKYFVGQEKIVKTLKIVIKASEQQQKYPDHILFYGAPGLGKTTLANIVANYSNRRIIHVQGSLLLVKADILALFASIKEGDLIFIDEIHSINKNLEELIYSALEDNIIDIPIGPEGEKKIMRMRLNSFTLIGATTKVAALSKPIKDRFGLIFKLSKYTLEELAQIIINSALKLKMNLDYDLALIIADYSNFTPRIANRLVKRINEFSIYYKKEKIDKKIINKTFDYLNLFAKGLNINHIDYLKLLNQTFKNQSASLDAISSLLFEEKVMIVDEIESSLLNHNFIIKTTRGRKITAKGIKYLEKLNLII